MNDTKKEESNVEKKTGVWPLIKSVTGEGGPPEDPEKEEDGKEGDSGSSEEKSEKQD